MRNKIFKRTLAILTTMLIAFVAVTPINALAAKATWCKDSKENYYYKDSDGEFLKGFQTINGNTYYFGKDGKMYTNKWVTTTSGNKYYFRKNGTMVTASKIKINGKVYEFDSSGKHISFDIWAHFVGLKWGMTNKEVIKVLDLKKDDYTYLDDFDGDITTMVLYDKSDINDMTMYLFDKTSGLTSFSYTLSDSESALICVKNSFSNEGFELFSEEDNDDTYSAIYVKDNLIGIVVSLEDDFVGYFISSIES